MSSKREIVESPIEQGVDEIIPYTLTVPTSWGTLSSVSGVVLKTVNPDGTYTDVSATNLTGSNSVASQVITTKSVTTLTANTDYRLEIKFVCGSKTYEAYCIIKARE